MIPHDEIPTPENTIFSRTVRRMLGLDLDAWNVVMLLSLGCGALAAVAGVVSTAAVIRLQKASEQETKLEFERYKLGVAAQVADAKKEGIEAGEKAGNAMLRAAELEKDAANARLETEKMTCSPEFPPADR